MEALATLRANNIPPRATLSDGTSHRKPTILVAEDADDTRMILTRTLEFDGYQYLQAKNGEEAIEKAIRHQPDLVLLDLRLPKVDGFQVLMRLRNLNPNVKVCIISAVDKENYIRRALDFGAIDYIVKPIVPDIISYKVRKVFEGRADPNYFRLPCALSGTLTDDYSANDCQIKKVSEVSMTLQTESHYRKGDVLSLHSPTLLRILDRATPVILSITDCRRNGRRNQCFDIEAELVGLSETQRQRLRAEIIRGKFIADRVLLN